MNQLSTIYDSGQSGAGRLRLADTSFSDELGTISMAEIPDRQPECQSRLKDPPPIIEQLWRAALYDVESNQITLQDGQPFYAAGGRGKGWNGMVFTRDIGYAGILGLNGLFPVQMRNCIAVTRRLHLDLGLKVPRGVAHPDLPFIEEDIDNEAFKEKYGTNPYSRRTDDVLWLWWAEDLFTKHFDNPQDWEWLYYTGKRCFDELYSPFFDSKSGLYRGQSTFVDTGYNGYPENFGRRGNLPKRNSLMIRAASTNALYYKGLRVMASVAGKLGETAEQEMWAQRAEALRRAFRVWLILPDGKVSYFLHEDNKLEDREHNLGTAFAILHGILEGEEAAEACRGYPIPWWGVPLFYPFFPNGETYHNNSAWPFASSFFLRAREMALGVDERARDLALLTRSCRGDTFFEWSSAGDKLFHGKSAQMWTIGAFIGRCVEFFGLETSAPPAEKLNSPELETTY